MKMHHMNNAQEGKYENAFKYSRCLAAAVAFASFSTLSGVSHAQTIVTATTLNGWAFNSTDVNGTVNTGDPNYTGALVNGPATPPLGSGSAELKIVNGAGDGSEQLRNSNYAGTPLSSITSLSYSTYDVTNNGQQFPYLKLYVSTTGGTTSDDALYFEPPYQTPSTGGDGTLPNQGATQMNTWQNWNAQEGGWWDDNSNFQAGTDEPGKTGVRTLADFLNLFPNTTIVNDGSLGGVRFTVGFSSPGDNYEGYVDDFTIGVNGVNTTYDFEAPEPASLGLLGIGGLALLRRRRK